MLWRKEMKAKEIEWKHVLAEKRRKEEVIKKKISLEVEDLEHEEEREDEDADSEDLEDVRMDGN